LKSSHAHSKAGHKRKTHGEADAFLNAGFC